MLNKSYIKKVRKWLADNGQSATADEMLLAQLSDAIDTYNALRKITDKEGYIVSFKSGRPQMHPAYVASEATAKRIIMLSDKLGLSPRARKGINIDNDEPTDAPSPLDKFV